MKHPRSLIACVLVGIALIAFRLAYSGIREEKPLMITHWDAFGYYAYLPGLFLYHDISTLSWAGAIDQKYGVTGGDGMPVVPLEQGRVVLKYLGGVAILQLPLFLTGHLLAHALGYPADGFSPPYQYALSFGVLLYVLLAFFLLRHILLLYFRDETVAVTLALLGLATNLIQYAALDNGLSHAYIFPLYVLVLYTTIRWHRQPRMIWAALTGGIIGLATICRPTEAIMLLIPLCWQTQNRAAAREKWQLVRRYPAHILATVLAGILAVLPQLLYWKTVSGSFVYDVGSKWVFLNPNFRVLTGWEKGWLIYTPVTILFLAGMFFIRRFPFRHAVLWFCLLNIWIVISWDDWRYGASYSCRALVQSYPLFALPLAALVDRIQKPAVRFLLYATGAWLIFVNLFQITQYRSTILHFDDMNRRYYGRIFLNPAPSPLDMSLLDTGDWIPDEGRYRKALLWNSNTALPVHARAGQPLLLAALPMNGAAEKYQEQWLKVESRIIAPGQLDKSFLEAEVRNVDSSRQTRIRLFQPVGSRTHEYAFFVRLPAVAKALSFSLSIRSAHDMEGRVERLTITRLYR